MPWGGDEREDDPDATEFIRELANETPTDLGAGRLGAWGWVISFVCAAVAGVQVFNLTKSLPAEPYDQSGPKLLTRNTTRRAWNATFEIMKGRIKRVAMLGVPGIGKSRNLALGLWHGVTGNLPEGFRQPEAIVYEAREGAAVFLFTKGQDGKWKAQRLPMSEWAADACPYLRDPNNWYLVDAFEEKPTNKFYAKTWLACSPERDHYSKFIKDGGCCVYIESWSKSELEAASCQIQSAPGCDMLKRYDKIGGNLRALLSAEAAFNKYVKDQESEAENWQHLQPAFKGSLDNQGKKLLTRLFTYISKDAREYEVDFCCAGAAALVANAHYDKLVELWSKQDEPARYWFQKFVGPLLTFSWFHKNFAAWTITNEGSADRASWQRERCDDLKIAENLQLLECDSTTIFEDRWQMALQKATLSQQVLSSPAGYPGIDYLLEFNHGIQVTTAGKHNLALQFREKLKTMFNGTRHSFTLTFLTTGDPERFAPVGGDFNALRDMAGPGKLFDNVRVQVVQIPKTLNSLS